MPSGPSPQRHRARIGARRGAAAPTRARGGARRRRVHTYQAVSHHDYGPPHPFVLYGDGLGCCAAPGAAQRARCGKRPVCRARRGARQWRAWPSATRQRQRRWRRRDGGAALAACCAARTRRHGRRAPSERQRRRSGAKQDGGGGGCCAAAAGGSVCPLQSPGVAAARARRGQRAGRGVRGWTDRGDCAPARRRHHRAGRILDMRPGSPGRCLIRRLEALADAHFLHPGVSLDAVCDAPQRCGGGRAHHVPSQVCDCTVAGRSNTQVSGAYCTPAQRLGPSPYHIVMRCSVCVRITYPQPHLATHSCNRKFAQAYED
mmetsp:Transcript_28716/g.84946  ORF Transcript_28716/g.84946 Transcript_28716/m.84946 type:complete len:317 (-) Transcript_28716:889-1839(-)